VGSKPTGGMDVYVLYSVYVVRGLCNGPIPCPEESYRLWCVFEYDQMKIMKIVYTYSEKVGRRGKDYEYLGCTDQLKRFLRRYDQVHFG
jgi:hypothetical protein